MLKRTPAHNTLEADKALLENFSVNSRYSESFRTLRTNLNFSMMEKNLNSLLVTSTTASEGKTNTVANIAHTIAQTGKTVLMLDADLRKPGLTSLFHLKNTIGLTDLLSDLFKRHATEGRICDYGLDDLISLINIQKRTCILNIADATNETELSFSKGEFVDIVWKNRPESSKLENTLVQKKMVSQEDMQRALGYQLKTVSKLGDILLAMKLISDNDLSQVVAVQIMEALRTTVEMVDGVFRVRTVSEEEVSPSSRCKHSFEQFFGEHLTRNSEKSYINRTIDTAIHATTTENLFILPSGSTPPNPSELLGSNLTTHLLKRLEQKFDVVVIDSSPVMPVSDPLLLASQVDGVILIIQCGATDRKLAQDVVQQLMRAQANLLGAVLNKVEPKKGGYYYKYSNKYYGH